MSRNLIIYTSHVVFSYSERNEVMEVVQMGDTKQMYRIFMRNLLGK